MIDISGFLPQKGEVDFCHLPNIHLEPNGSVPEKGHVRFRENGSEILLPCIRDEVEVIDGKAKKNIADSPTYGPGMKAMRTKPLFEGSKNFMRPVHVPDYKESPRKRGPCSPDGLT